MNDRIQILQGDVRAVLRTLPADHFDCVITSPPYWGLRDYGVEGQIGQEPTLGEHLDVMLDVFREVWRVLKPSGTLWLNYGDCYATTPNGRSAADTKEAGGDDRTFRDKPMSTVGPIYDPGIGSRPRGGTSGNLRNHGSHHGGRIVAGGFLKPKDLCMIPNRLAIALQDDGWWVRSEIIWGKPNPMPDSSGRYRPATAHEKIFLLTKSEDGGFWVARDTGEISSSPDLTERCIMITSGKEGCRWIELGHFYDSAGVKMNFEPSSVARLSQNVEAQVGSSRAHAGARSNGPMKAVGRIDKQRGAARPHAGFNERWDGMTHKEQGANGRNLRNYEGAPLPVWEMATRPFKESHFATFPPELVERCLMAGCPRGGAVLDPFGGAGTTALVAEYLGYSATLIELNPDYAAMAETRLRRRPPASGDGPLFTAAE